MEIKIALAGNPNCGKTTLFNALTGSSQYVGNWPGVTVEKKEGRLKGGDDVIVTDLPGVYSLSPYTPEEIVTRDYILNGHPDVILNLVDGSCIERNLYLTTQLTEMGLPVVIALNMMDLVRKNGDRIDTEKLSALLGCPVTETAAVKGEGSLEAAQKAVRAAGQPAQPQCLFDKRVEEALAQIQALLQEQLPQQSLRWYAVKLFERDPMVLEQLHLPAETALRIEELTAACEKELDDDSESLIINGRYSYIAEVVRSCVHKRERLETLSDRIDRIVTNRWLALPIFAAVMIFVYWITVSTLGTIVTDFTNDVLFGEWIQPGAAALLEKIGTSDWMISLTVDGIIGGLAAPIGFVPQMAMLFLFLSVLEDAGYMARVAFIMDRIFRRFGLSGKSFIPLMISSGCGVPGIMAARTIENENDRRLTMMTTTFIPCGAKLPVIALIAGAMLGGAWWAAPLVYFIGIGAVVVSGILLKKTKGFSGEPAPFVMELPQYHLPSARNVLLHVWERVWSFLKKAGTVLFLCCGVMWFLGSFGTYEHGFGYIAEAENARSLLEYIGSVIAPVFAPLGFGNWQSVSASLSGFAAKEGIVTTMGVIAGLGEEDAALGTAVLDTFFGGSALAAFSFLLFNLLDSPCLAAISTLAKEMNNRRWTWFAILYQNVFAYGICLMVYQFGRLFTGGGFGVGTAAAVLVLAGFLYLLFRPASRRKSAAGVQPVSA